jgi:peroxiredoxin (alkyl hydroperoxide reductase subunit C)
MSLVGTKLLPFSAEAYVDNQFIKVSDEDLKGKWSILFFYPADFTFVCPTELEDLADFYPEFKKLGVQVYSVSTDTHFTHMAWHDSSKAIGKVQFPMIGDPTGHLSKNFGVYIEESGLDMRGTFVVDPNGRIVVEEVHDEGIGRNASELLRKVQAAQFVASNPGMVCPAKWAPGKDALKVSIDLVGKI